VPPPAVCDSQSSIHDVTSWRAIMSPSPLPSASSDASRTPVSWVNKRNLMARGMPGPSSPTRTRTAPLADSAPSRTVHPTDSGDALLAGNGAAEARATDVTQRGAKRAKSPAATMPLWSYRFPYKEEVGGSKPSTPTREIFIGWVGLGR